MNKAKYLIQKADRLNSQNHGRPACLECRRPQAACLCNTIEPLHTNVHFRILMHKLEAKTNQVGTGRLANRALQNCKIHVGVSFEDHVEINEIISHPDNQVFLLYPSADSLNIAEEQLIIDQSKRLYIFILDSTWACSRKMLRLSPNLQKLPKISFTPNYLSRFDIKRQPKKYCLSTIESIYRVVQELEKQGIESLGDEIEILPNTLKNIVDFQIACTEKRLSQLQLAEV